MRAAVARTDGDRARLARDLKGELAGLEGVSAVWTPDEYAGLGLPTPEENPRVGDLLLDFLGGKRRCRAKGPAATA